MNKQANSLVPRDPAKFKRAIQNSYIAIALLLERKGQDGKITYEIIGFARAISDGYGYDIDSKPCVVFFFSREKNQFVKIFRLISMTLSYLALQSVCSDIGGCLYS